MSFEKRVKEFDFDELYEGVKITVWVNPPLGLFDTVQTGTAKQIFETLATLIQSWNVKDAKGKPLKIESKAIRNELPSDLVMELIKKASDAITRPKAVRLTKQG